MYGIYGASGFGRETLPAVREQLSASGIGRDQIVFLDDRESDPSLVNDHRCMSFESFLENSDKELFTTIAIADWKIRKFLSEKCELNDVGSFDVKAKNSLILDEVTIGNGAIICPFVTITSNVTIGRYFHCNIYSYVAHDCEIGDYVTFAPAVKCNGNVVIEDCAYIGTGAIIKQGEPGNPIVIGRGAIVGMGAVVTKSVPAGSTVVGNPARVVGPR